MQCLLRVKRRQANSSWYQIGDLTAKLLITDKYNGNIYRLETAVPVGDSESLTHNVNLDELNLPFGIYNVTADIYSG